MAFVPEILYALPPECIWIPLGLLAFGAQVFFYRSIGPAGLVAYVPIAYIGGNLQLVKIVDFSIFPDPLALGTVLFTSTWLATDILTERHGRAWAFRAIFAGVFGHLLFVLLMLATLSFRPLGWSGGEVDPYYAFALEGQKLLENLFTPQWIFLIAGLTAFTLSQALDITIFDWLRRKFASKHLWLRNNLSTMVSTLVDNTVFSLLAWIVLASEPLPLNTVVTTFIFGTWALRLFTALADTPFLYLALYTRGPHQAETPMANGPAGTPVAAPVIGTAASVPASETPAENPPT